jgi:hypothetical protein
VDDLDELLCGLRARIAAPGGRVDHMVADMVFDDLCDEPVERASTSCDLLQNRRTLGLRLHRAFNCLQLTADASDARPRYARR